MKKILISLACVGVILACTKEELSEPAPKATTAQEIEQNFSKSKRVGFSQFDPIGATSEETETEINSFKNQIENEQLATLTIEEAEWYIEALLNYENCDYVPHFESEAFNIEFDISSSNGSISPSEIVEILETISDEHVTTLTANSAYDFTSAIDVELSTDIAFATIWLGKADNSNPYNIPYTNFDREKNTAGTYWYMPSGQNGGPGCGGNNKGSNIYMSQVLVYKYSHLVGNSGGGGSGYGTWVQAPHCNGQIGNIYYTSISKVRLESPTNWAPNWDQNAPSGYTGECLTRQGGVASPAWCVNGSEITYYASKAHTKSMSSWAYNQFSINTALRPHEGYFSKSSWVSNKLWQVPYISYGKCNVRSLPS